jgi:hypothetical protein
VNEWLMRVVVQAAAFFELVDDDVLDPDTAVKQLESIAYNLKRLSPAERQEFVSFVLQEAASTRMPEYREFLLAFPDAAGLDGPDEAPPKT